MFVYEEQDKQTLSPLLPPRSGSNPYLLKQQARIVGCAGLITNDFISRGELLPWLCALYIEPDLRAQGHARTLINHLAAQTKRLGFDQLHLCTDLDGFYVVYDGQGYHPWGEVSRVYTLSLSSLPGASHPIFFCEVPSPLSHIVIDKFFSPVQGCSSCASFTQLKEPS